MANTEIKLGLDSEELKKGLEEAKKKLLGFESSLVKAGSSAKSVTKITSDLELTLRSANRELNFVDKSVLALSKTFRKTSEGIEYITNVSQVFLTSFIKLSEIFAGFGLVSMRVLKAINIDAYKKWRNYIIGLGLSTAKTNHVFSNLLKTLWRFTPLWARYALGIGGVVIAYKALTWAIKKAHKSLSDLNKTIESNTNNLLLIHKNKIFELGKEYEKLRYKLTTEQALMLSNYEESINYFKQKTEAFNVWLDLNNPFKNFGRKSVSATKSFIQNLEEAFSPFLTMRSTLKEFDVWELMKMPTSRELREIETQFVTVFGALKNIKSLVDGIPKTIEAAKKVSKDIINLYLERIETLEAITSKTMDQIIDRFAPFREFIGYLSTGGKGAIDNLNQLKEILNNLSLSTDDLGLLSAAMQGIRITEGEEERIDVLLQRIKRYIEVWKESSEMRKAETEQAFRDMDDMQEYFENDILRQIDEEMATFDWGLPSKEEIDALIQYFKNKAQQEWQANFRFPPTGKSTTFEGDYSAGENVPSKAMSSYVDEMGNLVTYIQEFNKETDETIKNSSDQFIQATAGLMAAAAAWDNSAGNLKEASALTKASAILQNLAAISTATAATAQAYAAEATATATFNWAGMAGIIGIIASIIGLASTISRFEKGGIIALGPGSIPKLPKADTGMIIPSSAPDSGVPIIAHPNEAVLRFDQIGQMIGYLAQRVMEKQPLPVFPSAKTGTTNIIINANGAFDSESFWEHIWKTKIAPAKRNAEYGN